LSRLGFADGARLCLQDKSQRVDGGEALENLDAAGYFHMLRLIPPRETQPPCNRNAVASFSPALADALGLRRVRD